MRLFGKKSDHPLADIKSAQSLLDDLPKTDAIKSLQELTDILESIREMAGDFRLDHQWALLRMFDQAAQGHVRKLLSEYFTLLVLSKFQENRLRTLLDNFYTQSEQCHHEVLTRYRNGDKGVSTLKPDLALLCARGISLVKGRLKLAASRHSLVDPALWKHLAGYYGYAESQGFEQYPMAMYTGLNTTVVQEFSVLVTWYGSTSGTLNAAQCHIAECIYSYLGKGLKIGLSYNGFGLYVFDMAQPTPPMRATVDATIHPSLRFIEAEGARLALEGLVRTLDKGIFSDGLNFFGAKYEAELVADVARKLLQSITLPAPKRRNQRRKINVNLKVANGFSRMLEQTDVGLNFNSAACEVWEVEDMSATGFRSVVPLSRVDDIKIGSLLGSRAESVSHWGAGVVRRLSFDENNNLHIGVELLSTWFIGVSLYDKTKVGEEASMWGLYLNRPNDTSGEAWLLMKSETFTVGRSLVMNLDGKEYLLLPVALSERGDDFDLARYRMMKQETEHEE